MRIIALLLLALAWPCRPSVEAAPVKTPGPIKDYFEGVQPFSFAIDKDGNSFPDLWFRDKSKGTQDYHSILIDPAAKDSHSSLLIGFSGGKAGVFSWPVKLNLRFAYTMNLRYKAANLSHGKYRNRLNFGVRAYDKRQKLLQVYTKTLIVFPEVWQAAEPLRIDVLPEETDSVNLFINIEGNGSGRSSLWVDDVALVSSPRVRFSTARALNIFEHGEPIRFRQVIEGTNPGAAYELSSVVTDFRGRVLEKSTRAITGNDAPIGIESVLSKVPGDMSGVYYVNSILAQGGTVLTMADEIVARNGPSLGLALSPSFGVILGHPEPPYDNMLTSLKLLGAKISKLDLFPPSFSIQAYSTEAGLVKLNPLLKKYAPDEGFQFIGVLNQIPLEALSHPAFEVNPPEHMVDTFTADTLAAQWQKPLLEDVMFKYGNVISDWQIGSDSEKLDAGQLAGAKPMLDYFRTRTRWMQVLIPSSWEADGGDLQKTVYVPASTDLRALQDAFENTPQRNLAVTLQLDSQVTTPRLQVIANLSKKIAYLKTRVDAKGSPIVRKIFIDRLVDANSGLMTTGYKPHSTYFAAKTMMDWMQGATYLGQLQFRDKAVSNYVFENHGRAIVFIWRSSPMKDFQLFIDEGILTMDLMGNQLPVETQKDKSVLVDLDPTPIFLISPNPELFKTMISYRLARNDISAKVALQEQVLEFQNHFTEMAKLDFNVSYPSDWLTQNTLFTRELAAGAPGSHKLQISPSAVSKMFPVEVLTFLDVSLNKKHHHVRIYREDRLGTDVSAELRFFKAENGLEMQVSLELDKEAKTAGSFVSSALLPDGKTLEAFFSEVQPGARSTQNLFVLEGQKYIGQEVNVEIKENVGDRYISQSFPVELSY